MRGKRVFAPDAVLRVHDALRKRFRAAGYGTQRRTEEALGLYRDYFADKRKHRVLDLGALLLTLEKLEVHPAEVFVDAFGEVSEGRSSKGLTGTDELTATTEELIKMASDRLLKADSEQEGVSWGNGEKLGEKWLRELDGLRDTDPHLVLLRIKEGFRCVRRRFVARALGVYGSACRVAEKIYSSKRALETGLQIAEEMNDLPCVGDLFLRLSYSIARLGERKLSVELTKEALQAYALADDRQGIAHSLVDQGVHLYCLGRINLSASLIETALPRAGASRYKLAGFHTLALCWLDRKDLDRAYECAVEASAFAGTSGTMNQGKFEWLLGVIAIRRRDLGKAAKHLKAAVEMLIPISSVDAALVSLDLIQVLFECSEFKEAEEAAKGMARLIGPLKKYRIVRATITELIRRCLEGRLSMELIERTRRQIRKERERPEVLSRKGPVLVTD